MTDLRVAIARRLLARAADAIVARQRTRRRLYLAASRLVLYGRVTAT